MIFCVEDDRNIREAPPAIRPRALIPEKSFFRSSKTTGRS